MRCYFHVLNGKRLAEHPTEMWDGTPGEMKVTDQPSPNRGRTYLTLTVHAPENSGVLRRMGVVIVIEVNPGALRPTCFDPARPLRQLVF